MKKRYLTSLKIATLTAVMLIITLTVLPLWVMADQKLSNNALADDEKTVELPTKSVSIEKKMIEAVITNTGDRYKLSDETIIVGLDGQQVSIRDMRVPCDAQITYEHKRGQRIAQRIKIHRVSSSSSWRWHSDRPE